jgi:hypothetical protein
MDKKKAARLKQKKKDKKLIPICFFSIISLAAFYVSYALYTTDAPCSFGGSKLSLFFAMACRTAGNDGRAFIVLIFGIICAALTWVLINNYRKSYK